MTRFFAEQRQRWMALGVGILLVIGGWLMLKPEPAPPPAPTAMPPHGPADLQSSQAYAMLTPSKQQLIGVTTGTAEKRPLTTTVRAVGRVEYDEQRIAHVNLRISGWVEELFVDYTGQFVRKGEPLLTLYSPDLVATQDEFLLALRNLDRLKDSPIPEAREQAEQLLESARARLRLWTLTDQQIDELARRGKPNTSVTLFSPIAGYVIEKNVFKGMYVDPERTLYSIADLSKVWMNAEIYEFEMPFVKVGQRAQATFTAYPGETFHGRVSYIYPYLNQETRTVKVRLEFPNPTLRLKPEMYGSVSIAIDRGARLAVPETAVLDSGTRQLVFLVRGEGLFEPREVKLGPKIGTYYEVLEGLTEGDRVVTSGTFLIDSESKLRAATHMMGSLGMGGVKMEQARMGEMEMGQMTKPGAPAQGKSSNGKQEQQVEDLTLTLSTDPSPPRTGENRIRVEVLDAARNQLPNLPVRFTYTMPGMLPATVPLKPVQGRYEATVNLGMAGRWDLTASVERRNRPPVKAVFSVTVGEGSMSGM